MIFLKRRAFMTFKFNYETSKGIKQVILTNCGQAPFKRFSILGNSHQDSTTGKQLFDVSALKNISGFSVDEDGFIMQKVYNTTSPKTLKELIPSIEAGKSYYLSVDNPDDFTGFFGFTGSVSAWHKNQTFVPKEDDLNIRPGIVSKVGGNARYRLMITEGQTASPYEPYTGGKPSPSHDYPQQIKNVGKWNEEKQKYEVDVRVTGKNLFDIDSFLKLPLQPVSGNDDVRKLILTLKPNTKYTLSTNNEGTCNSQDKDTSRSLYFTNADDEIYQCNTTVVFKGKKVTVTSDENGRVKIVLFDRTNSKPIENKQCYVMLNEGTFAEPYEPYFPEQTATITMDEPLRGIGKYQDKITKDGIVRCIKEIVLDDNSGWLINNPINSDGIINRFLHYINDMRNTYYEKVTVCDKFIWIHFNVSGIQAALYTHTTHGMQFYICLPKKDYPDVESFKQFLSKNPVTVQYALHNPVTEPLTQEQKSALESLCTFPGTTVITVDGGEVYAGIEVEYAVKNKEKI